MEQSLRKLANQELFAFKKIEKLCEIPHKTYTDTQKKTTGFSDFEG